MELVSLEEDMKKLVYYQADATIDQLLALGLHLEHIYEDRMVAFCIDCLGKHLRIIKLLASECVQAYSSPEPAWSHVFEWARDFMVNKLNTKYLGAKNPETHKLMKETRDHRKKMEQIVRKLG